MIFFSQKLLSNTINPLVRLGASSGYSATFFFFNINSASVGICAPLIQKLIKITRLLCLISATCLLQPALQKMKTFRLLSNKLFNTCLEAVLTKRNHVLYIYCFFNHLIQVYQRNSGPCTTQHISRGYIKNSTKNFPSLPC